MTTSSFTDYKERRAQLIVQDRALRVDHARAGSFTDTEIKADRVVRAIRAHEIETIWSKEHDGVPKPFPGMDFLTGKSVIVKTQLYEILSKMPKGALLHVHQNATVDARFLLNLALQHRAIHIRVPCIINASSIETATPEFKPLPQEEYAEGPGITDNRYSPNTWVSFQTARSTFDPALGGPEGFDKWLVDVFTINPGEAYEKYKTTELIWKKFGSTFMITDPIIRFIPILTDYLREFIRSSIRDGISYIEVRTAFAIRHILGEDAKNRLEAKEIFHIFQRLIKETKADLATQGREDEFVGLKIIYNMMRSVSKEEMLLATEECISLKKEFPDLVAGFDLVGFEDLGTSLLEHAEVLLRFVDRQRESGVDIPFLFHAGETLGDGSKADMNLYDAILLNTKRIGHGFSLVKHPKLMEICRERKIAIEVCPISNEILRLTGSMPMHPLPILINNGIPVVLCSDDPGPFNSMGLSFDFFQVLIASEVTGLLTLGQVARDSITFSMLSDQEKQRAMAAWEKRWSKFIGMVAEMEVPQS